MTTLAQIQERQEFLTQSGLRDSLRVELPWIKRDFLLKPWSTPARNLTLQRDTQSKAIMASNSDLGLGVARYRTFQAIYGAKTKLVTTNAMDTALRKFSKSLLAIPIGLTDFLQGSPKHELFSDLEVIKQAYESQYSKRKRPVISVTFSPRTHISRAFSLRAAKLSPFCHVGQMEFTLEGRRRALFRSAQSLGVLCPRGNGLDTHRLWETFYVGSVPIVRTGDFSRMLLDETGLPYLEIESWTELSDIRTMERLEELNAGLPDRDFSALGQDYWRRKILQFIQ